MRVVLTTWNGRVSPVLDVARQVLVLEVEDGRVITRHAETLPGTDPQAQARRLAVLAPALLICGAISQPMAALLAGTGIKVIAFIAGDVDQVLGALLLGTLPNPAFCMPGCGGRRRCQHGGNGGEQRRGGGGAAAAHGRTTRCRRMDA